MADWQLVRKVVVKTWRSPEYPCLWDWSLYVDGSSPELPWIYPLPRDQDLHRLRTTMPMPKPPNIYPGEALSLFFRGTETRVRY